MDFINKALFFIPLFAGVAFAGTKIEPVMGQQTLVVDYDKATDISGITWVAGESFMTVSNKQNGIFPLNLRIDPNTGKLLEGKFGEKISVQSNLNDFEGIAYLPEFKRLYISAEGGNGIVGFDMQGDATFAVEVPNVFMRARPNKSLESLTFGAGALWTANEGALDGDGKPSGKGLGTIVRLQKFDTSFRAGVQFAYRTEPGPAGAQEAVTGVSDMLALPDGGLLTLERVLTSAGLVAKIYKVDIAGATDTSKIQKLEGVMFTPAKKTLLYERHTFTTNYEGITLGPKLTGGWRSLILIADSGGAFKHTLMPLRIFLDTK